MESVRFVLAIALMIAVVVVTNIIFPPAPPEPQVAPEEAVTEPLAESPTPEPPSIVDAAVTAPTEALAIVPEDTVFVESPLFRYGVSTRGAALVMAELPRYESFTHEGEVVDLVAPDLGPLLDYRLRVGQQILDLGALAFEPDETGTISLEENAAPHTLRMTHRDPAGRFDVSIAYTFDPENYTIGVHGEVSGPGLAGAPQVLLEFAPTLAVHEANPEEDFRSLAYSVNHTRSGISSVNLNKVRSERIEEGPLSWVALRNKYFIVAAIPTLGDPSSYFGGLIARPLPLEHAADLAATLPTTEGAFGFLLYAGPQSHDRLAALGVGLEDANPYGWRFLRPIIRPLAHLITWALVGMQSLLGIGYGWVLILFGILIRVLLWPLNARAMRAQMRNMALQPRMQEIQQKYKNDPERLQKEMIRLYREEGFNPLGGCLPMLIPFPVLITLFFVFQNTIEFRGVSFLWLPDLSRPDPIYLLPVVLGASMFLMQWISSKSVPPNPQMKMMMYIMPIMMVVIFSTLASGLNLYYASQNLASIPQQVQIARERKRFQDAQREKERRREQERKSRSGKTKS